MKDATTAVLKAGLVPDDTVQEISRWNNNIPEVEKSNDIDAAMEGLTEAIEGEQALELRETDLDVLHKFFDNKQVGRLYYSDRGKTSFTEVEYMVDSKGDYVIPWTDSDNIVDFMIDQDTYLKPKGEERIYFVDAREIFYGDKKVFVVCIKA
jgi:hypothetical protein